jgi:16S rRNA processing protein RimM
MATYIHIGKFVATFGVKGELILEHALGKKTALKNIETIFVEERKGSYLPYFLQSSKAKDQNEIYVLMEDVNSKEAAHRFIHKNVWLADDDFRKLAGKSSAISLIGYLIVNDGTELSAVEEVIEQPHQVLVRITLNGNEALIPLHEESLVKIDHKNKKVHVVLPDGLLEIYG